MKRLQFCGAIRPRLKSARSRRCSARQFPGSARVPRVGDDVSSSRTLLQRLFRRDAETNTRDACATRNYRLRRRKKWSGETPSSHKAFDGSAESRPTVQCAGTMGPVSQQHAHPANRPTSHFRDEIVLLFRSIPSSNLVDRKFDARL